MATKNRAFLIAFRTLVASLSLFCLLMLSLQAFPQYRPSRLLAKRLGWSPAPPPVEASVDEEEYATVEEEALNDPFSGSVSGNDATGNHSSVPPNSLEAAGEASVRSIESQEWDTRLGELERCVVDLKMEQTVLLGGLREEVAKSLNQFGAQTAEMRTSQQRLESLEQQFHVLQERLAEQPAVEPPPERIGIRKETIDGAARLFVEARDVSLAELFAKLGETLGINLVVDTSVTGNVSLHLELPHSAEALKEVCRLEHCRHSQDGRVVVISRKAAPPEPAKPEPPATMTKLYRLRFITGAEIRPYVTVVLTPGVGTMGFANVREAAASTETRDPPRAILVKDTPEVLVAVDRLVQELDHPASLAEQSQRAVNATPVAAPNVPPPPVDAPVPAPTPAAATAPQQEQRAGCPHCTSIAPPVVTPGPRNARR